MKSFFNHRQGLTLIPVHHQSCKWLNKTHRYSTCIHGSAVSVTYKYFYTADTTAHIIITARAFKIVMEMRHGSVHRATFSIISAQNALETALFLQKKQNKPAKYTVNTPQFTPFQNYMIRSERVGSGVSAPLLEWC